MIKKVLVAVFALVAFALGAVISGARPASAGVFPGIERDAYTPTSGTKTINGNLTVTGNINGSASVRVAQLIPFAFASPSWNATATVGQCTESLGTQAVTSSAVADACDLDGASSVGAGYFHYRCRVQSAGNVQLSRCCINASLGCASPAGEPTTFSGYVVHR